MSQSEVDRFVADLKDDAALREELTGSAAGVASVVAFAQGKGYDISADEARDYIQAQSQRNLSDAELDAVAGGKSSHHGSTAVATVATVAAATTEAVAAATTVAGSAEVVAVAAVVLT